MIRSVSKRTVKANIGLLHTCGHASVFSGGVGGTVDSESALISAGTLLLRVQAPPLLAPWPDGGPERLRSPCCRQAMYIQPTSIFSIISKRFVESTSYRNPE
ncbi:hypothetical protein PoB_005367000 [Plakobranchus ocellatus]|uniref:Uncharacterized protein n=1 Tax=Plakobranchus ocellatus TaxID=259542 RepID=A0AAV4C6U6_9GAST|nr:hypothetical protein PoB_005367000 [Plakobranchus ocellatus]